MSTFPKKYKDFTTKFIHICPFFKNNRKTTVTCPFFLETQWFHRIYMSFFSRNNKNVRKNHGHMSFFQENTLKIHAKIHSQFPIFQEKQGLTLEIHGYIRVDHRNPRKIHSHMSFFFKNTRVTSHNTTLTCPFFQKQPRNNVEISRKIEGCRHIFQKSQGFTLRYWIFLNNI